MTPWDANLSAIEKRWPALAARLTATELRHAEMKAGTLCYRGLQVVTAYDRLAEAEAQADAMPGAKRCYGMGLGDLPNLLALRGPITVVLPNLEIARRAFSHRGMAWLHMTGVELVTADEVQWEHAPFACVPMECWLADEQGHEVRDRVFIKIHEKIDQARLRVDQPRVTEQIRTNAAQFGEPAAGLYDKWPGAHAVVVGAGPTLSGQLEWLKALGPCPIITCPAALRPLLTAGVVPHYVVIMESGTSNIGYLDGLDMAKLRYTPLCYNPEADPKFLDAWPGAKCHISKLFLDGTVLHTCADLATRMGATEVTLLGFDACRPNGKEYADGAGVEGEGYPDTPFRMWAKDGYGGLVQSRPGMTHWQRGMEDLIAARPLVKFYKRGRAGVTLKGATWTDEPKLNVQDAIKGMWRGEWIVGENEMRRAIYDALPIERKVEFDTAIERADFVCAVDVVNQWQP